MKGKMVLERKITKILKEFNVKAICSGSFYYQGGKIAFPLYRCDELDEHHREWIAKTFEIQLSEDNYFLFSLLHEVGHHFTIYDLTEEDLGEELAMREMLGLMDNASPKEINELYFNLPAEMMATQWALEFMMNHEKWCAKAQRKLHDAFHHFYNSNR